MDKSRKNAIAQRKTYGQIEPLKSRNSAFYQRYAICLALVQFFFVAVAVAFVRWRSFSAEQHSHVADIECSLVNVVYSNTE